MDVWINIILACAAIVLSVVLLRKKINLGLVMLMDSVFIAAISRMSIIKTLEYGMNGAFSESTVKLVVILFLIMMLENIMRNSGMISAIVDNLKELTGSNRLAAALLPTALGLLPSPGGARFSCPMVDEIAKENTDNENKAFINYWFRHIWLDGFILYPGIILAAELLKVSVIRIFLHLLPFMLVSILFGVVFGLTGVKKEAILRKKPIGKSFSGFLFAILPIIIVIVTYIILLNITPYSLEIASGAVVTALLVIKRYSIRKILKTAREAFPVKLVIIIIGVMVFKEILLDSGAIAVLSTFMNTYGIPSAVLFVLLPFIGGFTSGITVSYVSLTFPILIPLGLDKSLWFAAIAFAAGSVGNMITPLHLCAVMTTDYFKSSLTRLLKKVAIAEIPLLMLSIIVLIFMLQ